MATEKPEDQEWQDLAEKAAEQLQEAIQIKASFSATTRWALQEKFQFVID